MLSNWGNFLSVLAQSAIALLALLFVSFQITRDRWTKSGLRKLVAVQTLLEFLVPSFFAIIALLPIESLSFGRGQLAVWQIGGIITSILGLVAAVRVTLYGATNRKKLDKFGKTQLKMQPIALAEYLLTLVLSVVGSLTWASIVMVWLLLSGTWETWLFFAELGRDEGATGEQSRPEQVR